MLPAPISAIFFRFDIENSPSGYPM
jgi:hypothetical protein